MEEYHGLPGGILLPEGIGQLSGPLFADAGHLGQLLGMLGENIQRALAKFLHQELCGGGAHPPDQAGAQIALDAQEGGGLFDLAGGGLPLLAILGMLDPHAGKGYLLPGGQGGQHSHHGDLLPAHTHLHYRVSVFLIAEDGILHDRINLGGMILDVTLHGDPPSFAA